MTQEPTEQLKKNAILEITNTDGFHLIAKIDTINKFKEIENCVILKLSDINIVNNPSNSQTIQQLLSILGVNELTYLIMTCEGNKKSENGEVYKFYKLVNENLDTILLFNKI
jgi:adenylosuccinate synthase